MHERSNLANNINVHFNQENKTDFLYNYNHRGEDSKKHAQNFVFT